MNHRTTLLLTATILSCGPSAAFELSTHALMTNRAYERSVLATDPTVFARLGIDQWVTKPAISRNVFGAQYHEIVDNNGSIVNRIANPDGFEFNTIPRGPLRSSLLEIPGWLMRGAIREDDFPPVKKLGLTILESPNPQDAPDSSMTRVSNHFYDPYYDRALDTTINFLVISNNGFAPVKAVDWATGDLDSFAANPRAETNYRNHYSLRRAREAM